MDIVQLYAHSPISEIVVECIYGWMAFPEVLKCPLNYVSDLPYKHSDLVQSDISISNDFRCSR